MKPFGWRTLAWLFLAGSLALHAGAAEPVPVAHGLDLGSLDRTTDPCLDFYQFANGHWLANTVIPSSRSTWGTFGEMVERGDAALNGILDTAARDTSAPKGSIVARVGAFYRSGMDMKRIEADGAKPLSRELSLIRDARNLESLQTAIAKLHQLQVFPVFQLFVDQDPEHGARSIPFVYQRGLGMRPIENYLDHDAHSRAMRGAYLSHLERMFRLLGDGRTVAGKEAESVLDVETKLAKRSLNSTQERDVTSHRMMSVNELNALTPTWSWTRYFAAIGLQQTDRVNVTGVDFLKAFAGMLHEVPLQQWRSYLRWTLLNATAEFLGSAFANEQFAFNHKILEGVAERPPRWEEVTLVTNQRMAYATGQLYVEKMFSSAAKAEATRIAADIKAAMRERLAALEWMGAATKQEALRKLDAIRLRMGYPDHWRDVSELPSADQESFVGNVLEADAFEFKRTLATAGKPIDPDDWSTSPAYLQGYAGDFNAITITAALLQAPLFDLEADRASNYGGIGTIMGHELTHYFDDQGRHYDATGDLRDWWTKEDAARFELQASLLQKQYDDYIGVDDLHVNGKLTLGENLADLGGLKMAYLAFKKTSGDGGRAVVAGTEFTSEQRFFIAFSQAWRRQERPDKLHSLLLSDPHPPYRFRTRGPLSNMPEFFSTFGCKPGHSFERPPDQRVDLW